jgi:hypothetical protein
LQHKEVENVKNIEIVANAALKGILLERGGRDFNRRIVSKLYISDFTYKQLKSPLEVAEVILMPEGYAAPFLMEDASKQEQAIGRNILVLRSDVRSIERRDRILENIFEKKVSSAIIGLPRLGKTTELNYYAIKIFESMGHDECCSVKVLLLRIGIFLYHCELKTKNGKKVIEVKEKKCGDLKTLAEYCREYKKIYKDKVVLILDLLEDEIDPKVQLPFITSLSSRDADKVLKTKRKSGRLNFFLSDMPNNEELEAMIIAFHDNIENNEVFPDARNIICIDQVLEIARKRCDIIGNFFTYAIGTEDDFKNRELCTSQANATKSLEELNQCSIFNVPENVKYFFQPVLKEGVVNPNIALFQNVNKNAESFGIFKKEIYNWGYITENAKNLVYKQLNKQNFKNLKYLELAHKYYEDTIQYALMRDLKLDKAYHCDKFKWYSDRNGKIVQKELIRNPIGKIPLLKHVHYFKGMYIKRRVDLLQSEVLYRPITHNAALYDMFYVESEKKTITLFQVSSLTAQNHIINMQTFDDVMEKMKIVEKGYQVHYVYVNDWNSIKATGFFFIFTKLFIFFFFCLLFIKHS